MPPVNRGSNLSVPEVRSVGQIFLHSTMILGSGLTTVCQQILLPTPHSLVALLLWQLRKTDTNEEKAKSSLQAWKDRHPFVEYCEQPQAGPRGKGIDSAGLTLWSPSCAPMLPKEEKRVKRAEGASGRTEPALGLFAASLPFIFLYPPTTSSPPSSQSVTPVLKTPMPSKTSSPHLWGCACVGPVASYHASWSSFLLCGSQLGSSVSVFSSTLWNVPFAGVCVTSILCSFRSLLSKVSDHSNPSFSKHTSYSTAP